MSLEQLLAWIPPGSPDESLARQINVEQSRMVNSVARSRAYPRRVLLPIPASPVTTRDPLRPSRASRSRESTAARSAIRPSTIPSFYGNDCHIDRNPSTVRTDTGHVIHS